VDRSLTLAVVGGKQLPRTPFWTAPQAARSSTPMADGIAGRGGVPGQDAPPARPRAGRPGAPRLLQSAGFRFALLFGGIFATAAGFLIAVL